MRWLIPDPGMFPHEVSITRQTWNTDVDGGRMIASQVTYAEWPAFVQSDGGKVEIEDDIEKGERRVSYVQPFTVDFRENPKLNVHDIVTWIDDTGDDSPEVHVIQVTGSTDLMGLRGVWEVSGEERS